MPCTPAFVFASSIDVGVVRRDIVCEFFPFDEYWPVATLLMPTIYFNWCENCNSKSALYASSTPFSMPMESYSREWEKLKEEEKKQKLIWNIMFFVYNYS